MWKRYFSPEFRFKSNRKPVKRIAQKMEAKVSFQSRSDIEQPNSFYDKKADPVGTCARDAIVGLFLPWHFVPAALFNEFSSIPVVNQPEFFEFSTWFGSRTNWATQIAA